MASCGDDDDVVIKRTTAFSETLIDELLASLHDETFTDFKLKTGDKVMQCHRLVIAAISPVLKAMLKSQMREATEKQIKLDNISPRVLNILLNYMYCGEARIPKETLKEVVEAADFLQLDELKQMCVDQAPPIIQPDNVLGWFKLH